jgi:hypothetical protein
LLVFQCLLPAGAASGSELKQHARFLRPLGRRPEFADHYPKSNSPPALPDHGVRTADGYILKVEGGNSSSRMIVAH